MSYRCYICGKKPVSGKSVSHSKRATNRYFRPNLQKMRILVDGVSIKKYVCTACIRSNRITKVI